ncbi:MAG: hypothetical protein REJ50_11400 [Bordetella sp.]|nr:hypothetical protein [Bordetella sp.]
MNRLRCRALGAVLLAAWPMLGWGACAPLETPFSQSAAAEGLRAQALSLELPPNETRVLLGQQGERVVAGPALIDVAQEGDLLPRTWTDAVDWSVYGAADAAHAATVLQRDADGRLCRIERFRVALGQRVSDGGFRLAYDAQGRLIAYASYDTARRSNARLAQACLRRDAQGRITAFHGECAETPRLPVYYVRDAQGALERIIDLRAGALGAVVHRYGADGKVAAVYRARPDASQPDHVTAHAVPPNDNDRVLVVAPDAGPALDTEIPDEPWQLVRVPADTVEGDALPSWDPAVHTVLMQGRTDATGKVALAAEQVPAFHQALRDTPGRVFLYISPMARYLPLTALGPDVWRACTDPGNTDPKACG